MIYIYIISYKLFFITNSFCSQIISLDFDYKKGVFFFGILSIISIFSLFGCLIDPTKLISVKHFIEKRELLIFTIKEKVDIIYSRLQEKTISLNSINYSTQVTDIFILVSNKVKNKNYLFSLLENKEILYFLPYNIIYNLLNLIDYFKFNNCSITHKLFIEYKELLLISDIFISKLACLFTAIAYNQTNNTWYIIKPFLITAIKDYSVYLTIFNNKIDLLLLDPSLIQSLDNRLIDKCIDINLLVISYNQFLNKLLLFIN